MSKKPVPGLMSGPHSSTLSRIEEAKVGARKFTRFVSENYDPQWQGFLDADSLFNTSFGDHDVASLLDMVQEAGFPESEIITLSEREAIAERFVGAAPNNQDPDPKDWEASLAWVLVHFSLAEFQRHTGFREKDLGRVWTAGVRMGRLAEWWVFRGDGHDLGAVQQASFSSGRKKQAGAEAVIQAKDQRRQAVAEIVGKLGDAPRFNAGKKADEVNFSAWARKVLKEARIGAALAHKDGDHAKAGILNEIAGQTEKTVIYAIKSAIQGGEIGKTK